MSIELRARSKPLYLSSIYRLRTGSRRRTERPYSRTSHFITHYLLVYTLTRRIYAATSERILGRVGAGRPSGPASL